MFSAAERKVVSGCGHLSASLSFSLRPIALSVTRPCPGRKTCSAYEYPAVLKTNPATLRSPVLFYFRPELAAKIIRA